MTKPCIENTFVVPAGCNVAEAVKTTINGCASSKVCFLLEELKKKSKNNNVELFFLKDVKYHVKCNGKEGIIDVPQEFSTFALLLMMEYLNKSPLTCNTCRVRFKKGECPKTLFT